MATSSSALSQQLTARVTYVDIQSGDTTYSVFTLDGALALWANTIVVNPAALGGADPVQAANGFATNYCQTHPGVDCSQQGYLVAAYGGWLAAFLAGSPLPQLPLPPATPIGSNVVSGVAYSAVAPIPPPPPPIDQSVPSSALAALMTTTPTPATTPTTTTPTTTTPTPTANPAAGVTVTPTGPTPKFIEAIGAAGGGAIGLAGLAGAAVTFGISIVASILVGLFAGIFGGSDTKQLQQDIVNLRNAMAQIADEQERFSWSIAVGLGRLWQAVAEIWDNFLDALWTYMKQLWNLLWTVVSQVIPQIINVLRELRKFLDAIYLKYILPAMRYLQYVRQVLALLRAMGVPIASRLDKILGQIQGALFSPFLYMLRSLGGYGGWFNFILTSRLILQRPLFLNTMYAYQADWINMFYTAQSGQLGPVGTLGPAAQGTSSFANYLTSGGSTGGSPDTTAQVMTVAEACSWITVFATTESGELADTAQESLVLLRQYLGI